MKFTLSWLKDHLETTASVDEITYALTDLGLEVEGVEDRGAKLRDFTIGFVKSAEKHPDADRLRVCQVETDEGVQSVEQPPVAPLKLVEDASEDEAGADERDLRLDTENVAIKRAPSQIEKTVFVLPQSIANSIGHPTH